MYTVEVVYRNGDVRQWSSPALEEAQSRLDDAEHEEGTFEDAANDLVAACIRDADGDVIVGNVYEPISEWARAPEFFEFFMLESECEDARVAYLGQALEELRKDEEDVFDFLLRAVKYAASRCDGLESLFATAKSDEAQFLLRVLTKRNDAGEGAV